MRGGGLRPLQPGESDASLLCRSERRSNSHTELNLLLAECTPCCAAHSALQDEVGELKRRLAVTAHQADQLKGEVAAREGELQREKYDKAKVWQGRAGQMCWLNGGWEADG